jgi:hypothetical protein
MTTIMIDAPNTTSNSSPTIHPYSMHWLHALDGLLPRVCELLGVVIGVGLISYLAAKAILKVIHRRQLTRQKAVFLELTPPISNDRLAEANEGFYDVLHGLGTSRSLTENLLHHKLNLSLEYLGSREQGIRYVMRAPIDEAPILEREITAHMSDMRVKQIDDPLPKSFDMKKTEIIRFQLSDPFAFPLNTKVFQAQHDQLSYITNALTQLSTDEFISLQLIITPAVPREASTISARAVHGEDLLAYLKGRKIVGWNKLFHVINAILLGSLGLVGEVFNGSSSSSYNSRTAQKQAQDRLQVARGQKPAHYIGSTEQQSVDAIHDKVSQPLFYVSFRAVIVARSKKEAKARAKAIESSLAAFRAPQQRLKRKRYVRLNILKQYHLRSFRNRKPQLQLKRSMVLSGSELAALYHFPRRQATQTENLVVSLSRTLPAPLSLKQNNLYDLTIGRNYHNSSETNIGLSAAERERHVYVIGGTGNGKTTMLQYAIVQDMYSGKGVAVIDPHGDMAETLLRHIPEERLNEVIYFNPDDLHYPIGLNLLELQPGLSGKELLREKELITESVVSIFRKIFSDEDTGGHRIEYVLRCTIQTALTIPDATLFTVFALLNDPDYRKKIVKTLKDENLTNFWKNELGKAGEFQRVKMAAGITAKIGRFLFSASAKQILEQPKSTIDFDEVINSGKILICNFSKGLLGEDTSGLFGITILAKLQLATLRRARIQQDERRPFYVYVDEFQNFATASFEQMLSESRKYKLYLTMAEQSTSQQKDQQMVNVILANVGTIICFRTGNPQDERLFLPLFVPHLKEGDIANLSAFNFFAKLSAVEAQEPLSGRTIVLEDEGSQEIHDKAIELSRANYAKFIEEEPETPPPASKDAKNNEITQPKSNRLIDTQTT